jgi:hypothetical protein
MDSDEDELKVLYQRIENEKIIVNRELDEMYKQLDRHDKDLEKIIPLLGLFIVFFVIIFFTVYIGII